MSCTSNKTAARAEFVSNSFASGSTPIQVYEKTLSTNNEAEVSVTKGVVTATLTFTAGIFPATVNGTGKLYLKISQQTDGESNTPPVEVENPAVFKEDTTQTVTMDTAFTSTTYADQYSASAPTFSAGNVCGSTTILGWKMTDSQVVMNRTIIQAAYVKYS